MADYRWYDFQHDPVDVRFAEVGWIAGRDEWAAGMRAFPFGENLARAHEWVSDIRRVSGRQPRPACPRVFVSHRQADEVWARRIAWLAWKEKFDYWLDVIDFDVAHSLQVRVLEAKLGRSMNELEKSILTAAVIEMALLNCTHVLAVMTDKSAGSQWVPYEYGRVKEPPPLALEASCWWDVTTLPSANFPEYLYLGPVLMSQAAISAWLQTEKTRFPGCMEVRRDAEPDEATPLPTG